MKKVLLALTLIPVSVTSFSQTVPPQVKTKDYYLTKSRHQKTTAWIMLCGGVAIIGVGLATAQADVISGSDKEVRYLTYWQLVALPPHSAVFPFS